MSKRRFSSRPTERRKPSRARRGQKPASHDDGAGAPRLQKVLAAAGLGSRRQCEELIREGRVEVDRRTVTELGTRVDPTHQEIRVDGEPLPKPRRQYFMLNKPMGVVSTARDPAGRPRVTDLVPGDSRLFPVGRLDLSSEGLILLTNDGELANLLAHPRYEVEKTYLAQVAGSPSREAIEKLERGVHLAEGFAHAKQVRVKKQHKQSSTLEIVLDEGRNREVRRLLARVGHKVLRLKRIAVGSLRLGNLAAGEYRPLRQEEVRQLQQTALATIGRKKDRDDDAKISAKKPSAAHEPSRPDRIEEISPSAVDSAVDIDTTAEPRRQGTVIGEDFDRAASPEADRSDRSAQATSSSRPARRPIKPLIDVRRGIFPGRVDDDFDEDELNQPIPEPPKIDRRASSGGRRKRAKKQAPARRQPRAAKKGNRKQATGRPPRRKERRR